ncbi:MAG: hypothetical protein HN457_18595 [Opitutales bacterium]|jgi:hypothetical protein|nr:hypothetical protein [Opitutales bacterium]MDG2255802.1 hypothetical protein [Opitutaceae bacterium]MBT5168263.1 hypothetical protein [Opitutales bacterium]MBT5816604.1 hypothetical protein [Opitutales bacterium]MBT6769185.1 hypothetical protein [Opitutales bacterium]
MIRPIPNHSESNPSPLRNEYEDSLKCLELIEKRLGTVMERENDLKLAQEIAHRLSNIQMLLAIRSGGISDPTL